MINVPLHRLLLSDSDLLSLVSFVRGGRVGLLLQHNRQGSREDFVSLIPLRYVIAHERGWIGCRYNVSVAQIVWVWEPIAPCSLLYGRLSSSGQSGRMVTRRQGPKEPSEAGKRGTFASEESSNRKVQNLKSIIELRHLVTRGTVPRKPKLPLYSFT